ncbi:MAG: hypothetical protein FRX48_00794 [Lasallia pustulata]|uniref:Uncharacterized protein n=1 Tax=Lasallia pustulata TaxID=136370 RepID=A0A5M8Q4D9_9LECA|nr:MAG: hypothetical protein FRX48_00794 [Lasallia pustulata]
MKSSFAARRKARVVGQDAPDDPSGDGPPAADSGDEQESTPIVKRPPSQKSSLRLSFNPSSTPTTSPDIPNPSEIFIPRKSALSRRAIEKNALRNYTASALHELRNSTPPPPKPPLSLPTDPSASRTLDIFSKFGSDLSGPPPKPPSPQKPKSAKRKPAERA